jgi:hypothetical protein
MVPGSIAARLFVWSYELAIKHGRRHRREPSVSITRAAYDGAPRGDDP